jgi:capsular exopolysaccharide synthesis family protein
MSRLDEALRRATGELSAGSHTGSAAPLATPWVFGSEQPRAVVPPAPQPRPAVAERPSVIERGLWRFTAFSTEWRDRLVSSSAAEPALVEQFRRLAATLHYAQTTNNIKSIMVTSAAPGDGKTMTSMNLAIVLSGSYARRVLLIDADLRRPSIQAVSQLPEGPGLSDALKADLEQKLSVFPLTENLVLLPAGRAEPDPMSGLTSPRMRRILDEATENFDWVIMDAPPIGLVTDASLLAQQVDAMVLVVRAGKTPYQAAHKALDVLGRERILGIVLNGVDKAAVTGGYGGYGGYGYYGE